jgi:hypothetical protein
LNVIKQLWSLLMDILIQVSVPFSHGKLHIIKLKTEASKSGKIINNYYNTYCCSVFISDDGLICDYSNTQLRENLII